jgi:hypothetical protein
LPKDEDAVIEGNTLDRLAGFAAEWARRLRSDAARLLLRTAVVHRHPRAAARGADAPHPGF